MKTNFHDKSFALSLAFIMRLKATRKWPTLNLFIMMKESTTAHLPSQQISQRDTAIISSALPHHISTKKDKHIMIQLANVRKFNTVVHLNGSPLFKLIIANLSNDDGDDNDNATKQLV